MRKMLTAVKPYYMTNWIWRPAATMEEIQTEIEADRAERSGKDR